MCFISCATTNPIDVEATRHILPIDRNGEYYSSFCIESLSLKKGQDCPKTDLNGQIERVIQGIANSKKNNKTKILIFIHGGLNKLSKSIKRAAIQYGEINKSISSYAIFINWRSGPLETYFDQMLCVREGLDSAWGPATFPIYLATDIAKSIANSPKSWIVEGSHSITQHQRLSARQIKHIQECETMKMSYPVVCSQNEQSTSSDLKNRAIWVATSPLKIVTTPFVFTLGEAAWNNMRRRAFSLFHKPSEFISTPTRACRVPILTPNPGVPSGALAIFMRRLNNYINEQKRLYPNDKFEITLVGHSMGAIVSNELIKMFPDVKYKNIVYMGAASSIRELNDKVIPYLRKNGNDTHFYNLSLHPEAEDREISMYGLAPSGSLLVWIDSMYTTPETHLDRTLGRWDNVKTVMQIFPQDLLISRMHFKVFGFGECEPKQHGEFDEYRYWDDAYWIERAHQSSLCN
jgi:hypothetical protein